MLAKSNSRGSPPGAHVFESIQKLFEGRNHGAAVIAGLVSSSIAGTDISDSIARALTDWPDLPDEMNKQIFIVHSYPTAVGSVAILNRIPTNLTTIELLYAEVESDGAPSGAPKGASQKQ